MKNSAPLTRRLMTNSVNHTWQCIRGTIKEISVSCEFSKSDMDNFCFLYSARLFFYAVCQQNPSMCSSSLCQIVTPPKSKSLPIGRNHDNAEEVTKLAFSFFTPQTPVARTSFATKLMHTKYKKQTNNVGQIGTGWGCQLQFQIATRIYVEARARMFYERARWFGRFVRRAAGEEQLQERGGGEGKRRWQQQRWRRRWWFTLEGKVNSSCCFKSLGKPRLRSEELDRAPLSECEPEQRYF